MNKENMQFTLMASSDLDYEKMVIYLHLENNHVAILNCDTDNEKIELKLLDKYEDKVIWSFDCQAFIKGKCSPPSFVGR